MATSHAKTMRMNQISCAYYNTPWIKSTKGKEPSKELVNYYRELNTVRMLHRNLMTQSKEIKKLETLVNDDFLVESAGHKFRTTLKAYYVLEENFETAEPRENMRENIGILKLLSAEQNKYRSHLEQIILDKEESQRAERKEHANHGRLKSVIRVTDLRRMKRKHEKSSLVLAPWLSNIVKQKVAETEKNSGVRKKI